MPLREQDKFRLNLGSLETMLRGGELVFIGQPNNPTGMPCDPDSIRTLAARHPDTRFVIDEAFADFVEDLDRLSRNRPANVVVLLSLTKIFAIPGLRLGCAIADASIVKRLRELQTPWSVNVLAQAVGTAALQDREYVLRTQRYVSQQRSYLIEELQL
jgi:histidinol-phosphate/aromatic aminotransferase/cobyric acid decarboxylase-like protein